MNNICQICEESVASGVMCDDGVYRCIGCAVEDDFDIQTGLPVEIAAQHTFTLVMPLPCQKWRILEERIFSWMNWKSNKS